MCMCIELHSALQDSEERREKGRGSGYCSIGISQTQRLLWALEGGQERVGWRTKRSGWESVVVARKEELARCNKGERLQEGETRFGDAG